MKSVKIICLLCLLIVCNGACFTVNYTAKGYSIPPEAKTISILYFNNTSDFAPASLGQEFTTKLRERFEKETNLLLVDGIGDLHFEGEIVKYQSVVSTISADETGGTQRFVIGINVRYMNSIEPKEDFENRFEKYEEYPAENDFSYAEENYTSILLEEIIDDIFNKAFVNW